MMPVRIRSDRGVSSRGAVGVAADARRIAQRYADDAAVQGALAEAEFDAGNLAAAEAAADRAIALEPNNRHGLIYKSMVLLKRGREAPAKTDWAQVRSWVAKANRLDPDDPHPLLLYYQTFNGAGVKPSDGAVKALIYAAQLVPQDKGLRMLATRQLLIDNKLPLARQMYAAIAYDVHASVEARVKRRQIMDAIVSGNAKAALALLDPDYKQDESALRD